MGGVVDVVGVEPDPRFGTVAGRMAGACWAGPITAGGAAGFRLAANRLRAWSTCCRTILCTSCSVYILGANGTAIGMGDPGEGMVGVLVWVLGVSGVRVLVDLGCLAA